MKRVSMTNKKNLCLMDKIRSMTQAGTRLVKMKSVKGPQVLFRPFSNSIKIQSVYGESTYAYCAQLHQGFSTDPFETYQVIVLMIDG